MSKFKEIAPGFEYASFDYTEELPEELRAQTSKNLAQENLLTYLEDKGEEMGPRRTVTHFTVDDCYYVVIARTYNNTGVWVTHNDVLKYPE